MVDRRQAVHNPCPRRTAYFTSGESGEGSNTTVAFGSNEFRLRGPGAIFVVILELFGEMKDSA